MAKPQLEDGFTRIAHEIIEVLIPMDFTAQEYKFILLLIRYTFGWRTTWVEWSNKAWSIGLGIDKQRINKLKNRLLKRKVIIFKLNKIRLNKNYSEWRSPQGLPCSPQRLQLSSPQRLQAYSSGTTTVVVSDYQKPEKRRKKKDLDTPKDSKDSKDIYSESFLTFWKEYPRKDEKFKAAKAFETHLVKKKRVSLDELLELLVHYNKNVWAKREREYIPLGATWLNKRLWEDSAASRQKPEGGDLSPVYDERGMVLRYEPKK